MSRLKTWHIEALVAALCLLSVALIKGQWIDFVSAAAVLATFCHMQIGDRLAEQQKVAKEISVHCYRYLMTYMVAKELLWVCYFLALRSYPALVGCALFLLYPMWRKWWRQRSPLEKSGPPVAPQA